MSRLILRSSWLAAVLAAILSACSSRRTDQTGDALNAAAESYVHLALALAERDPDSLDSYHGPSAWQAQARTRRATLADIQTSAAALAESLAGRPAANPELEGRRRFLLRQLRAVVARIDILRGARPPFADEARALFELDVADGSDAGENHDVDAVRAAIDRLLPGHGDLTARYAAFDRTFLIAPDRLAAVLARAIDGCRAATRAHVRMPATERVEVEYVGDLPWSAFTRYEGGFKSRIQVNAWLPLTVDRALDLACHEAYPGHHTIAALLDARFGGGRVEFLVQLLFSPQSLLHEAAASLASAVAFSDADRTAFERAELFPLAGLDSAHVDRYVRVCRLVDQLHGAQAAIARRYLDGALDFPRASAALAREALMPSADATLKFLNEYRTYSATYTLGRDALSRALDARQTTGDATGRWRAFIDVITDPAQIIPVDGARK